MSRAVLILTALYGALSASERPEPVQNVIVHKEAGRFGGWPANNGIWSWGNEIVVGIKLGYFKPNEHGHAIDPAKPSSLRFARRLDGGRTWKTEMPSFNDHADAKKNRVPRMPRRPDADSGRRRKGFRGERAKRSGVKTNGIPG